MQILRGCQSIAWVNLADTMLGVVKNLPCLQVPEVDEVFWKTICEATLSPTTPIAVPYSSLVHNVVRHTVFLRNYSATAEMNGGVPGDALNEEVCGQMAHMKTASFQGQACGQTQKNGDTTCLPVNKKGKITKLEGHISSGEGLTGRLHERNIRNDESLDIEGQRNGHKTSSEGGSSCSATTRMPRMQQKDGDGDHAAALRVLQELRDIPVSVQLLKDANGVCQIVNQVSKLLPSAKGDKGAGGGSVGEGQAMEEVVQAARRLRRKWKAVVREESRTDSKGVRGEKAFMGSVELGARAVSVQTWMDVYIFAREYEMYRQQCIGKRALALAHEHDSKKRRMQNIEEKLGDAAAIEKEIWKGKPAVGNTERIRKLIKYRPTMSVAVAQKAFGGLKFVPPKKKKHFKVLKETS